jgi:hypothetical protein
MYGQVEGILPFILQISSLQITTVINYLYFFAKEEVEDV